MSLIFCPSRAFSGSSCVDGTLLAGLNRTRESGDVPPPGSSFMDEEEVPMPSAWADIVAPDGADRLVADRHRERASGSPAQHAPAEFCIPDAWKGLMDGDDSSDASSVRKRHARRSHRRKESGRSRHRSTANALTSSLEASSISSSRHRIMPDDELQTLDDSVGVGFTFSPEMLVRPSREVDQSTRDCDWGEIDAKSTVAGAADVSTKSPAASSGSSPESTEINPNGSVHHDPNASPWATSARTHEEKLARMRALRGVAT
eukprot:SAG31_NODE_4343_length_3333_cov_1.727891_2_plen_260_part_00